MRDEARAKAKEARINNDNVGVGRKLRVPLLLFHV